MLHFACSLFRKSDSQDATVLFIMMQKIGDPRSQNASLSRAGAGYDPCDGRQRLRDGLHLS
jgi:hypothetical protein